MKRKLRISLIVLGVLLLAAALFRESIYRATAGYLVRAGDPQQADIVVVLAGDSTGGRITTGAELVRQGYAPRAIVSGPAGSYGNYECDLAIPFAVKAGFPESYFEHNHHAALSTADEARILTENLRGRKATRVLLVTSDYHTRRSTRLFRAAYPEAAFFLVASPDRHFSVGGWWKDREGRKIFLMEWMKTVAEWLGQ